MHSHSASSQGLSVKFNDTPVKLSLFALKEKREDSTEMRNVILLICSGLSGDVTHTLAAIVEVPFQ